MEQSEETIEKPAKKPSRWYLKNSISLALILGIIITLISSAVVDINLTSRGSLPVDDNVNRYFDTCVGEGFGSSTPLIFVQERGFPLSHYTSLKIPICDNLKELKRISVTQMDWGAFGANILFWTLSSYFVIRKVRKNHSKD
jgi:hypothetical protein